MSLYSIVYVEGLPSKLTDEIMESNHEFNIHYWKEDLSFYRELHIGTKEENDLKTP